MKKYKHRSKLAFLWLLLAVSFFVCSPFQVQAEVEWKTVADPATDPDQKSEDCTKEILGQAYQDPWWKPPLSTVMKASNSVGAGAFQGCAGGMRKLIAVGAGLWLATFMMKVLGGMVESDPLENLTKVGGMMLRVGFAACFLQYSFFKEYIFDPIIGLVTGLSGGGGDGEGALMGLADQIHNKIAELRSMAAVLRCVKPHAVILFDYTIPFWDLGDVGGGIMVGCVALLFNIAFPFFLFDAVFRMGVTIAVCPLFVGAWVFEATRGYAKKGVNATMNVAFVFLMVSIAANVAVELIKSVTGLTGVAKNDICKFRMLPDLSKDGTAPCDGGVNFSILFILAICAAYGVIIMKEGSDKLANYFSDASFSNDNAFQAAKGAASAAVNAPSQAVNTAQKVAHTTRQVASGVNRAAAAGAGAIGRGVGAARNFVSNVVQRVRGGGKSGGGPSGGGKSGPIAAGGKTRLNANASLSAPQRPQGVPASASYNAKNQTWTASSTDKNGNTRTTVMDKGGKRQSVTDTDKNGNVTSQTRFKDGNPVSTTTATYNDKGQKTSETISDGGKKTTRNFDDKGRLASQTERNADGTTTKSEWKRDANGRVTGSSVETRFNDGSKQTTVFDHDANGKRTAGLQTTTDASGREKTLYVDENGQRPKGISENAQYDSRTQTWSTNYTDKKTGETTRTVMNKQGERQTVTKTKADGTVVSDTRYGKNGNPISSTGTHIG